MAVGGVVVAALVALAALTSAQPDAAVEGLPEEDLPELLEGGVSKRDLEFNQYVPGYRRRGEPTCEELREMWRLSKREARRATTTNQLPRRTQHTYGRLIPFAPEPKPRSVTIYGKPVVYPPTTPRKPTPLEEILTIMGPGNRKNRIYDVHNILAASRPNKSSKGSMDTLIQIMNAERAQSPPVSLGLRATRDMYPNPLGPKPRRDPPTMSPRRMRGGGMEYSNEGFLGPLLPADSRLTPSFSPWQPPPPSPSMRSCEEVQLSYCQVNAECACAGLYRCSKGRCKVSSKHPVIEDTRGSWYAGPLEAKDLGVWSRR